MNSSPVRRTSASRHFGVKYFGLKTALAAGCLLALGFTVGAPATAQAQAYYRGVWSPDYDGYPPPIPPGDVGHRPHAAWAPPPPGMMPPDAPMPVTISEMRRRATLAGLKLLGTPHRKGEVFIAFGEDSHGKLHHLAFDVYEGRIVENEVAATPPKPAAAAATPATTPSAAEHGFKPKAVTTATPASDKPADKAVKQSEKQSDKAAAKIETTKTVPAKPETTKSATDKSAIAKSATAKSAPAATTDPAPDVTARDLSPIKPQPGAHHKPEDSGPDINVDVDIDKD